MARLDDDNEEGISLFPMFNILACTLGVMVFILATVATVSLGADKAVDIVANVAPGETEPRTPIWIEWDGTDLTLLPTGEQARFAAELDEIATWEATWAYISASLGGTRLGARIADVGLDTESQYIVLLVRPEGFDELPEVRGYFEFLGIDVGYEPIDPTWQRLGVN